MKTTFEQIHILNMIFNDNLKLNDPLNVPPKRT